MAAPKPTLYINTYASDPLASSIFYQSLGFVPVPAFCDGDKTQTLLLPAPNSGVCLMVHSPDRMEAFIRPGTQLADAHKSTEALLSIPLDAREDVDGWLQKAVQAGGKADPYVMEGYGAQCGMYSRSFADLDGHIWEVLYDLPKESGKA